MNGRAARLLVWVFAIQVMVSNCTVPLVVTGQTTSYHAADDGDLKLGVPIAYYDNGDGTITDLNTKLMWEKKCKDSDSCPAGTNLHNVSNRYDWNEGIWQWIAAVNAENDGRGYAGHNDWRIPNLRELQSIINYGLPPPSVNSIFGPTGVDNYWSSTTRSDPGFESPYAWFGGTYGGVGSTNKHDFEPCRSRRTVMWPLVD